MKKSMTVLLAIFISLSLAACVSSNPSTSETESEAEAPKTSTEIYADEENPLMNKSYSELELDGNMTKSLLFDLVIDMTPGSSENIPLMDFLSAHKVEIYEDNIQMINLDDYEENFDYLFMINKQVINYNLDQIPENMQSAWAHVVEYAKYQLNTWNEIVKSEDAQTLINNYVDECQERSNAVMDAIDIAEDTCIPLSMGDSVSTDSIEFEVQQVELTNKVGNQTPDSGMVLANIICEIKNADVEKLWIQDAWSSMKIVYSDKYEYKVNPLLYYASNNGITISPLQTISVNWYVQVPEEVTSSSQSLVLQFSLNGDSTIYQLTIT